MSKRERLRELERLARGIRRCGKCRLHAGRKHAVPGEGDGDADVMLVGEGPGEAEDDQGRPFVGRSGKFLDRLLADLGLRRGDLFITSSVKCRPPGNRTPRPDELDTCRRAWLTRQIECIRPKCVLLLGRTAIRCLLGEDVKLAEVHGQFRQSNGARALLTYHPTAAMRFPKIERRLRADLRKLQRL